MEQHTLPFYFLGVEEIGASNMGIGAGFSQGGPKDDK